MALGPRDSRHDRRLVGCLPLPSAHSRARVCKLWPIPGFVNKVLSADSHSHSFTIVHGCFYAGTTELRSYYIDPVAHKPETSTLWLFTDHLPSPAPGHPAQAGKPARAGAHQHMYSLALPA